MTRTILCFLLALPALAELTCDKQNRWNNRLMDVCEIKVQTLSAPKGAIQINPGLNGGITVKGWDRAEVEIHARIDVAAPSESEARSLIPQIRVASGGGQIKAEGPEMDKNHSWSVSYEVFVPRQSDLDMTAHNGGIRLEDVKGSIRFEALNGGVSLKRLAGDVSGHTTNGGLDVELAGDRWDGKGLDVNTTNGGVKMKMPATYSAHVETATVNGGLNVDFPVSVSGKINRHLSFNVGRGGPTVRVVTTNGGVNIHKS